ncbi:MAG: hypothetical protein RL154_1139 [Pseudomonadota bacterium]|jgi:LPS sulfotransferase NodH
MNQNNVVAAIVGALAGAAATYAVVQNKDKIIEKFNDLEKTVKCKLEEKGITKASVQDAYDSLSKNVHTSMDKLTNLIKSKDQVDKEYILAELAELKAKVSKLDN